MNITRHLQVLTKESSITWLNEIIEKRKIALLLASHDIDLLYTLCDKVIIMGKYNSNALNTADYKYENSFKKDVLGYLETG